MRKTDCTTTLELFCAKKAQKNTSYWKIESILEITKISHHEWVVAHAKWSVWVKNEKNQKGAKTNERAH